MENQIEQIRDYLEKSYDGAKAMDDVEVMCRIARAMLAFDSDVDKEYIEEFLAGKNMEIR